MIRSDDWLWGSCRFTELPLQPYGNRGSTISAIRNASAHIQRYALRAVRPGRPTDSDTGPPSISWTQSLLGVPSTLSCTPAPCYR